MEESVEMNYSNLENVICDTIKENQIKIGYEKETVRLYYPMSSLAHILGKDITNTQELDAILNSFVKTIDDKLGNIEISHAGDRYCFIIPPTGVQYIHEAYDDNPFLIAFIQVVNRHDCSLEKLLEVFHTFSDNVHCEKSDIDDFDYVIYFVDNKLDNYRYCIKFEGGHTIYHRFIKEDYDNL
ncbi:MAG: hypothetical protein K0S01_1421 [Herbinix sp.]|jgi:hypothetical protein|nr:hypothetical protein [Herbinix sp.]